MAFFIYHQLAERWEGMSGTYMGKDWTNVEYLFKLYEIEEPKTILIFMQMIDRITVKYRMQEAEAKRKNEQRKQKGGKTYAHRVQG